MRLIDADGVDDATVDAIPVEWLKAHAREYVEKALKMWKKEQEARR